MTLNLDDLERVAKAATPGPWRVEGFVKRGGAIAKIISHGLNAQGDGPAGYVGDTYGEADAKFVAALNPAVCLALISRARGAERLEKERKEATDELVKHMVNRFLWWRLPEDFHPDCGIHFDAYAAINMNPRNTRYEPVGTNLFTATQAEEMVRHMLEGAE